MPFKFDEVNYLGVLVAGLGTFFLGAVWYTAIFGSLWRQLGGYTDEKIKEMQAKRPPAVFFGGMLVCYLVAAFVMGVLVVGLNLTTPIGGAALGLVVWILVASIGMTGHLAGERPIGMYLIDVGFQLVFLIMMGALLATWR